MARQGELKRLHVIQKVLERVIKQVEAAEVLPLSGRQIRRIVKRIRSEGSREIIHRSRGAHQTGGYPMRIKREGSIQELLWTFLRVIVIS
jgi:hypothetical protein